jgi:hypothetical protein
MPNLADAVAPRPKAKTGFGSKKIPLPESTGKIR